jgi:hypothetical protein
MSLFYVIELAGEKGGEWKDLVICIVVCIHLSPIAVIIVMILYHSAISKSHIFSMCNLYFNILNNLGRKKIKHGL